jgi:DNA-directed RNA polymerase I subunit RPA43
MEIESPKKEKRKRKSEVNDEEPRKKKNKQREQPDFVPQLHMSGVEYVNGVDGNRPSTKKPKRKNESPSKLRIPADGLLPSGDNDDRENEHRTSEKKKKRKRETLDQEAPTSDPQIRNKSNVGVLKSNQQSVEMKPKKSKEMNSTTNPERNHILQADVHRGEKWKEKKKKKIKHASLALDTQDVNGIENKNHSQDEERRSKKPIGSEVETSGLQSQSVRDFLVHRSDDPERYLAEAKVQIESHEKTMQKAGWPDKLAKQHPSTIQTMSVSLRVPIPPIGQAMPLSSVCADTLSPMILRWDPDLKGVVLAYRNPKLVTNPQNLDDGDEVPLAQAIDEYAAPFVWVQADFAVFTPRRGLWLDGYINLQNENYIGMVIFNLFNATIERKRLPQDWDWFEDEQDQADVEPAGVDGVVEYEMGDKRRKFTHSLGHFEDGQGNVIDGWIRFRVWDFEPAFSEKDERHFLTIEGTLLTDDEEKALEERERKSQQRTRSTRVPVTPRRSALRNVPSSSK